MSLRPESWARRGARALVPPLVLALTPLSLTSATAHAGPPPTPPVTTWEYLPGVEADLYLPPTRSRTVPLVVMVPGGGWQTADRTGLGQLAEAFVARGIAVTNTTYRVGDVASQFPVPAQDVTCAVDASVAAVTRAGFRPGPVVLVGHSAGAHLSSLAAFGAPSFRTAQCPYPRTRVDGWAGLSGIYDLTVVGQYAWTMMGATAEEAPEAYALAATETYLGDGGRTHIDALVVQGDADELLLSTSVATDFADLLRDRGYQTQLTLVPGGDHAATYQAPVIADTILKWLRQVEPCRAHR